jgi:hypothetical protein
MRDRMPAHFTRVLKRPLYNPLNEGELHRTILLLALSYHENYEMTFPSLSDVPLLVHYTRHLALPGLQTLPTRMMRHTNACMQSKPSELRDAYQAS